MKKTVAEQLAVLEGLLREKLDPLGYDESEAGAYRTGHVPHVAPEAYLCWRYPGLDDDGMARAEQECGHYISEPYREFLRCMNGARILGVSLQGSIGGLVDRSGSGIGQPISLQYQNALGRPSYIPQGHLGFGTINGEWHSQGHLYLASTGEVELYNALFDMVGARWATLADFLGEEIPRRFSLFDEMGREVKGAKRLPGDTANWEMLAEEANKQSHKGGFVRRVIQAFKRS